MNNIYTDFFEFIKKIFIYIGTAILYVFGCLTGLVLELISLAIGIGILLWLYQLIF
jgi:hypothetical protein